MAQAIAGDEAAFTALYLAAHPRLRRYALSLVGQDADDVVAEAWLQIARDLGQFQGGLDEFRAWTARIVRNRSMDQLRQHTRRPVAPIALADLADAVADDDTARAALERIGADDAIRFIVGALPKEQAEAVMLRAVVGLDPTAAGRVLGKSPAAVRVCSHRGLKSLARLLGRALRTRGSGART